jgi:hypothetical protein
MAILNLPVEQRALAEIVQTTTDGKVVLFGWFYDNHPNLCK